LVLERERLVTQENLLNQGVGVVENLSATELNPLDRQTLRQPSPPRSLRQPR